MTTVQDIDLLGELEDYLDAIDSVIFALTNEGAIDSAITAAHVVIAELKRRALAAAVTIH